MPNSEVATKQYGTNTFTAWLEYTISKPNPGGVVKIEWTLKGKKDAEGEKSGHVGYIQGEGDGLGKFTTSQSDGKETEVVLSLYNYTYGGDSKRIVAVVRIANEWPLALSLKQEVRVFMRREIERIGGGLGGGWTVETGTYSETKIINPKVERVISKVAGST